ncbi:MAG: hypothetical protein CMM94_04905 [Rickettsiales bacterium]|nr:hypothetical protein [Rickettsiales bacterium]
MRLRDNANDYENIPVTLFVGEGNKPYAHEGQLQFHEVTVEQTTGSVQLRALFPNPDNQLLPGLFVRTKLALTKPDALLVPQHAATRQPDASLTVWKLQQGGTVQPAPVTTSGSVDDQWIVSDGLKAGDVIITEGLIGLRPGTAVTPQFIQDEKAPSSSEPGTGE